MNNKMEESQSLVIEEKGIMPNSEFNYLDVGMMGRDKQKYDEIIENANTLAKKLNITQKNASIGKINEIFDKLGIVKGQMQIMKFAGGLEMILPKRIDSNRLLLGSGYLTESYGLYDDSGERISPLFDELVYLPPSERIPSTLKGKKLRDYLERRENEEKIRANEFKIGSNGDIPLLIRDISNRLAGEKIGNFKISSFGVSMRMLNGGERSPYCDYELNAHKIAKLAEGEVNFEYTVKYNNESKKISAFQFGYTFERKDSSKAELKLVVDRLDKYNNGLSLERIFEGFTDCPSANIRFRNDGKIVNPHSSYNPYSSNETLSIQEVQERLFYDKKESMDAMERRGNFGSEARSLLKNMRSANSILDYNATIMGLAEVSLHPTAEDLESFAAVKFKK